MAQDLLFEIGTEEIPARFMEPAINQMKELAATGLKEARLVFSKIHVFGTPRRLALLVKDLEEKQTDLLEEIKGPSQKVAFDHEGKPTKAATGFARGQGVDVNDLEIKETPAGVYVFAIKKSIGSSAEEILPQILSTIVQKLYFPKPMRWGDHEMRFARPIRWLVALFGSKVLPVEIQGLKPDRYTRGHRFLGREKIELADPAEYLISLKENFVIADQNERKDLIWKQIREIAAQNNGRVAEDEELLNEVTFLLEYPTALCGNFEDKYLALPRELLITPMREHQRYFPVFKEDGSLLPKFITVRNGLGENIEIVTAGNEKVLKARLADAEFFYMEDLKKNLADNVTKLKNIVFHETLGSLFNKVERIQELAVFIGSQLDYTKDELDHVRRAAFLCKADLVSNVVYEFPELQGIMGEYYARHAGEADAVSRALKEHYHPRFAGDAVPESKVGIAVAIADKLDSITGFFGMGIQPTGSQDPYALRRQALGIVNTILQNHLELSLIKLISKAYKLIAEQVTFKNDKEKTIADILIFFKQRMENILGDTGIRYDIINAVLAMGVDNLTNILDKAVAVNEFRTKPEFEQLIAGFTRAANLAKNAPHDRVVEELFTNQEEIQLYREFITVQKKADIFIHSKNYQEALGIIAELRRPIDDFFAGIMVMVEDVEIRENRLGLLKRIADYVTQIADLSQIVV
ncbi:MAG: glycine--tRNA ligase subunit beta [Bacillota bacterium]|jgi:glycyl-tRNA synthetase beta chain